MFVEKEDWFGEGSESLAVEWVLVTVWFVMSISVEVDESEINDWLLLMLGVMIRMKGADKFWVVLSDLNARAL